jgi:hypothetical protein
LYLTAIWWYKTEKDFALIMKSNSQDLTEKNVFILGPRQESAEITEERQLVSKFIKISIMHFSLWLDGG